MTRSRYFLFGLLEVPMWGYMWGYTSAQIELVTADSPVVTYPGKKKKKGGRVQGKEFDVPDADDVRLAAERWKEKYGDGQNKKVKISLAGLKLLKIE